MFANKSSQDYGKLMEGFELALEGAILQLLISRGPGAVVRLSDAALAVGGDGWRALLELARGVARRMGAAGLIEFVERGGLLDEGMAGGDAAFRLRSGEAARILGPSRLN